MSSSIAEQLGRLGYSLPTLSAPVANYVPWTQSGNVFFISGQISQQDGKPAFIGRLGESLSVEEGQKAAASCALSIIAQIDALVGGDIHKVKKILRLGGFVSCTPEFEQHPQVMNGASDLIVAVFGERGRHARTAVGVPSLPRGVSVEVDAIVEVEL